MNCNPCICSRCLGKAEYYMLENAVWLQVAPAYVGPLIGGYSGRGKPQPYFLCLTCVETALGRTLVRDDFANVLLNRGIDSVAHQWLRRGRHANSRN